MARELAVCGCVWVCGHNSSDEVGQPISITDNVSAISRLSWCMPLVMGACRVCCIEAKVARGYLCTQDDVPPRVEIASASGWGGIR